MQKLIIPVNEIPYVEEKRLFKDFFKEYELNLSGQNSKANKRIYSASFLVETKNGKTVNGAMLVYVSRRQALKEGESNSISINVEVTHQYPSGLDPERPIIDLNENSSYLKFRLEDDILIGSYRIISTMDVDLESVLDLIILDDVGTDAKKIGDIFNAIFAGRKHNIFEKYRED